MKKLLLSLLLLSSLGPVLARDFFPRRSQEAIAPLASSIPTQASQEWLRVQVNPTLLSTIDSNEWTRIFWCDFKQISRTLVLSGKPYHKHPFIFKVHTRKLLAEIARHYVWICPRMIETMPERVMLFIDGRKCIIRSDSDLAQLLFFLAQ